MEIESAPEVVSDFEKSNRWITENYPNLKQKYPNQWVAVLDDIVLDSDLDLKKLVKRLKNRHKQNYNKIAVEYISQEETGNAAEESVEI
jgi:hypothetical protein